MTFYTLNRDSSRISNPTAFKLSDLQRSHPMTGTTLLRTLALPTILAVATVSAHAADFDRTVTVGNSPDVSVSTGSGYIHMRPGTGSHVHIIGHVRASQGSFFDSSSNIDARIAQIAANPPITQSSNQITIGERNNDDLYRNIVIDYDITLPRTSAIKASSGSGSLDIQDVGANLKAHSGSGSIHAHGIQGPADVETGSGQIELDVTAPGDVRAQTGSGTIHINAISGGLYARTGSGSIEVTGKPTNDWKLGTGSGSVHLTVGNAPFTLNANTGSGGIQVAQPIAMQSALNHHHISAAVNGGGPTIDISTGSGSIHIQ
jgi:hypothetical protein